MLKCPANRKFTQIYLKTRSKFNPFASKNYDSAASTAASMCICVVSKSRTSVSACDTSMPISVQPSIAPCAPRDLKSSMMRKKFAFELGAILP